MRVAVVGNAPDEVVLDAVRASSYEVTRREDKLTRADAVVVILGHKEVLPRDVVVFTGPRYVYRYEGP